MDIRRNLAGGLDLDFEQVEIKFSQKQVAAVTVKKEDLFSWLTTNSTELKNKQKELIGKHHPLASHLPPLLANSAEIVRTWSAELLPHSTSPLKGLHELLLVSKTAQLTFILVSNLGLTSLL